MRKDIQVGDVVRVVSIGPTSNLVLGAIVTVRRIADAKHYFVVKAENEDAYIFGHCGWTHKEFGPHCHNVHVDEIEPISRYHTLYYSDKTQTKIPII